MRRMIQRSHARHECFWYTARVGWKHHNHPGNLPKSAFVWKMEPEPRWRDAIKMLRRLIATALSRLSREIISFFHGKPEIRRQENFNHTEGGKSNNTLSSVEIMSISSPELDFLRNYHAQLLKTVQLQRQELARREEESRQIDRDLAKQTKIVEALRRERLAREENTKIIQQL